jgi:hypothetical protein
MSVAAVEAGDRAPRSGPRDLHCLLRRRTASGAPRAREAIIIVGHIPETGSSESVREPCLPSSVVAAFLGLGFLAVEEAIQFLRERSLTPNGV